MALHYIILLWDIFLKKINDLLSYYIILFFNQLLFDKNECNNKNMQNSFNIYKKSKIISKYIKFVYKFIMKFNEI